MFPDFAREELLAALWRFCFLSNMPASQPASSAQGQFFVSLFLSSHSGEF